ncbi:relaxase/mobilization nuclease domain-containing protein, partial [uncultured Duncaniella sp.]|uniref:relaxase/mobilization nuclease domain-containing protein n=2 Tax=uncultured Duncaniella sp. TaxID=2768039 RepID=UPI002730B7C8
GSGFGGCVDYVTRRKLEEKLYKEQSKGLKADERKYESNGGEDIIDHLSKDWKLLSSSGDIRIYEGRKAMADDIARPSRQRKPIKDPVGHISLDFHPDDAPKMTDELMTEVAQEYMRQMGLTNTPYIVVRHFDKAHPHCHIVFSRVDYDGKILTQTTNFKKNERVCKALNLKHRLTQGKSKLNTDVSKLRGKEKVRYQLVHDIARVYLSPSVTDWDSFVDWLHRNGITVREKTGKSGRVNLYFGVGGQEFWYRKLDPFFSRENLELKFKARREKLQEATPRPKGGQQPVQEPAPKHVPQTSEATGPSVVPKPKEQPKPIVIPPLPDGYMGARIAPHELARYQKGDAVCAYICKPDEIVGKHYWIWYDFKTAQPRCEPTPPPADRYIPEAFKQQMTTPRAASVNISQGAGIRFSSPSLGGSVPEEQGFAHGDGLPDDFKHFLEMHPGMSFEEAKRRFKDEQKAKQIRKGPKLH